MKTDRNAFRPLSRRAFLRNGSLLLASATATAGAPLLAEDFAPSLRVGLITDLHFADKRPARNRYYRETPDKLAEAATEFNKTGVDFVVNLGDLIDAADAVKTELEYLKRINDVFATTCPTRYNVLGNHCVAKLTKQEFLDGVEQKAAHFSFDAGDFHFAVLDACYRSDGEPYGRDNSLWNDANIPAEQIEWLTADLRKTLKQTVVFTHQRLDVNTDYGVRNAVAIRKVLQDSGKVLAVFQGHNHQNDHHEIEGIHYCTLVAMVEGSGAANNGYSTMAMAPDGAIRVTGFRQQSDYEWAS